MTTIARARHTDPANSHYAAESVTNVTEVKRRILQTFEQYGAMTHEQLVKNYASMWGIRNRASSSGLRSRCKDLFDDGYIIKTDLEGKTEAGRSSAVWGLAGQLW